MVKIGWPDMKTDGLIIIWQKGEELIALPIKDGQVEFGVHKNHTGSSSALQHKNFSAQDTVELKSLMKEKLAAIWKGKSEKGSQ